MIHEQRKYDADRRIYDGQMVLYRSVVQGRLFVLVRGGCKWSWMTGSTQPRPRSAEARKVRKVTIVQFIISVNRILSVVLISNLECFGR